MDRWNDDKEDNVWYKQDKFTHMRWITFMAINSTRKVLIVSSHPLFGKGIEHLLKTSHAGEVELVTLVSGAQKALEAIRQFQPDLVVVDEDDDQVSRDDFLTHFVTSPRKIRVVLLSLKEGGSQAVVYDRRTLAAAHIEDWL